MVSVSYLNHQGRLAWFVAVRLGRLIAQDIEAIYIHVSHGDYIHRDSFCAVELEAMLTRVKSEPHTAKEHAGKS
jgi:hypothetical protein